MKAKSQFRKDITEAMTVGQVLFLGSLVPVFFYIMAMSLVGG
jgi:hypothetical protein